MLTALALAALAVPAAAQTVNEPASGVAFPVSMTVSDGSTQVLLGTAIRTKTFLNVKVYAYGLYVDQAAARTALAAFAGKTAEQLAGDQSFYATLLRMGFPMTMRLVMTRNVSGDQMSEAFNEVLGPRVTAAAGRGMPGGEQALATFRTYFSVERLTSGTELLFTCTPDGVIHSRVGGEAKPPITSNALCWALFDVYLGGTPIMPAGKRTVVARTPEVLR